MSYTALDPGKIISSLELLTRRIYERFPTSGLYRVSSQLLEFCRNAQEDARWVSQPIMVLRISAIAFVLLVFAGIGWTIRMIGMPEETLDLVEIVPLFEAGINDILLISAGVLFLVTLETRLKRNRALKSLHILRSFAHVIDMHQLHKDPERVLERGELTPSTPRIDMSAFELSRYLDYCSEMLSLIGKTAGLYAQSTSDPVVIDTVSEIEGLSNGISRKIWQKLLILHMLEE